MTTRNNMFSRKPPPQNAGNAVTSLIAQGTCISGDIRFTGSLFLDGRVDGQVIASEPGALLTIGAQGLVRGNVCVPGAVIHGQLDGDIYAMERLEVAGSARIVGDLHYRSILVVAGAQINGRMNYQSADGAVSEALPSEPELAEDTSLAAEPQIKRVAASFIESAVHQATDDAAEEEMQSGGPEPEPLLIVQPRRRGRMR